MPRLFRAHLAKNQSCERDPGMHQVKKGNEWHFGMKMHIGTDDALDLIHSVTTTLAYVHDITQADQLLHGEEERVWGDLDCLGIEKREEHLSRDVDWQAQAIGEGQCRSRHGVSQGAGGGQCKTFLPLH